MRNHLDDDLLFAYLDDVLPSTERAELDTHLASCAACSERLTAHTDLFTLLDTLPELAFEIDVVAAVQAEIAPPSVRWVSLVQIVLIALGIGALQMVEFGRSVPQLPIIEWNTQWQMWWQSLIALFTLPTISAEQLPTLGISLTVSLSALLIALCVWLVGSSLILRNATPANS